MSGAGSDGAAAAVVMSADKAKELGATICFGPYDVPKVGRMAVITDPTGANFAMVTLSPH